MPIALFAFNDPHAAQRAVQRLYDRGFARSAVELHAHDTDFSHKTARDMDEQFSGGLFTNLLELFQGVFDWGSKPHDATQFADTVRRGGAAISVDAANDAQCAQADEAMTAEACDLRTGWSESGP